MHRSPPFLMSENCMDGCQDSSFSLVSRVTISSNCLFVILCRESMFPMSIRGMSENA